MISRSGTAAAKPARLRLISRRALAGLPFLLAGGCSFARVSSAVSPNRLVARSIPYGNGPRRSLDVYAPPAGPDRQMPRPVVVFLYGGTWESGDKASYGFVGTALARLGFVVVIPDYRVYPEVTYPAFLEDCASALAWTRRNILRFGGSDAPFIMGHSAGAYNAAMLTLDGRWLNRVGLSPRTDLRGMVGLAGPYDFLPFKTENLRRIFAPGQPPRTTQPIAYVDGHNPPMLLLAGSRDSIVPPSNTVRLAARIREAGGPVEERIYPGVEHGEIIGAFTAPLRFFVPSLRDSARFMHAPRQTSLP